MLLRYFFGEDVFISYTRADGITYAAGLANELARRDFSCFLDQWGTPPGRELPKPLRRALQRSTALVLVGSEGAIRSAAVEKEVGIFAATKRMIIPIDFDGALQRSPWYEKIAGLALTAESAEALTTGNPSPAVLSRIEKSFQYTRRNQRARRAFTIAAVLLLGLAIASGYYSRQATQSAAVAREQEKIARESQDAAKTQEQIAKRNAAQASEQAAIARAKTEQAERDQRLAEERRKIAQSRELASSAMSQLQVDPELSLLLAAEAATVNRTSEAESALRRALVESRLHLIADGASDGALSPDSRLLVTSHSQYKDRRSDSWLRITELDTGRTARELRWPEKFPTHPQFSPDGRLLLAICNTQEVCIFEAETGRPLANLQGHTQPINRARFSHDGKLVATVADDATARLWDSSTGHLMAELPIRGSARDAVFSPDDKYVLTTLLNQQAKVWETSTGREVKAFPAGATSFEIPASWSPDGKYLLTVAHGSPAHLWNTADWQNARDLAAGYAVQTQFSADSKRLLTVDGGNVQVWNLVNGERLSRFGNANVVKAGFSPDAELIVTAHFDDTVRLSNYFGQLLAVMRGHHGELTDVGFSKDGRWVITVGKDGVRVWDPGTGLARSVITGHKGEWVENAVFSPDRKLAVTTGQSGVVRISDVATGEERHVLGPYGTSIPAPVFSKDGKLVLTEDRQYAVHVWEAATGRALSVLKGNKNGAYNVVISPNNKRVATVTIDGDAQVWETTTGRPLFQPSERARTTKTAVFSPDGKWLVTCHKDGNNAVRVWDAQTGKLHLTLDGGYAEPERIAFSPDGQFIAGAGGRNTARVWDVQTGRKIAELRVSNGVIDQAYFSQDGASVITRGTDSRTDNWEMRQWDTQNLTSFPITAFKGNLGTVSPDGKLGLVGTGGNTVNVVELSGDFLLATLRGHQDLIRTTSFASDGKTIMTAGRDGTARVYYCDVCGPVDDLLSLAMQRLKLTGREFTPQERLKYVRQ